MKKINFRKKEISLLEAGLYYLGLKSRIIKPNLTEDEKKVYESLKTIGDNSSLSETKYLMNRLSTTINLYKLAEKREYCEKYGHKTKSSFLSGRYGGSGLKLTAWARCSRCGLLYERSPTLAETKRWDDMMHKEITI